MSLIKTKKESVITEIPKDFGKSVVIKDIKEKIKGSFMFNRSNASIGSNDMCCRNEINLCKLCSDKAEIKCLKSNSLKSHKVCSDEVRAKELWVEDETVNRLCVSDLLSSKKVDALELNANELCSKSGTIEKLCVNELQVGNLNRCEKFRAAVTFPADTVYTLGDNINWSTIIDDPNGNVSLAPFFYTVPFSGYYMVTFYLNSNDLSGSTVITGTPMGVMTLSVNGVEARKLDLPFLSFTAIQTGTVSSLLLLNAGDVLRTKYEVLILDPVVGVTTYAGTVDILANGSAPVSSGFEIHYLSSFNCTPGESCRLCPTVQLPCDPIVVDCHRESGDSCPTC